MVSKMTEIRHLPAEVKQELSSLLNVQDAWKQVALKIQHPLRPNQALFTTEIASISNTQSPFLSVLDDWGSHGYVRPNVEDLINVLIKCDFLNVANYILVNVLNEKPIGEFTESYLINGPSSVFYVESNLSSYSPFPSTSDIASDPLSKTDPTFIPFLGKKSLGQASASMNEGIFDRPLDTVSQQIMFDQIQESSLASVTIPSISIPHVPYTDLFQITNGFDDKELLLGGRRLGSGGFGIVYLGIDNNFKVAVKKIKEKTREDQFRNEIKVLSKFDHKNLLKMLSYSVDGPHWCIVFEYMERGSLQDLLAQKQNNAISWTKRCFIASGIARGLSCLHSYEYIHRDVKSANVLLNEELVPKLGDFGIMHSGPDLTMTSQIETFHIMGARVYMAPEAFQGIVSSKLDTYSFGVVLLELLTGSKPFSEERKETLTTFIMKHCKTLDNIIAFLDPLAGVWDHDIAKCLFELVLKCTEIKAEQRPTISQILPDLQDLTRRAHRGY